MHDATRTTNLLGAAALGVTELMMARVRATSGVSASGAAALVVLADAPGLSVTELGRRIGLSQSAAARMVDSLRDAQLVDRQPGGGREVALHLRADGRRVVDRILTARAGALTELVEELADDERAALDVALEALLTRLYRKVGSTDLLCRLCDRETCISGAECPVGAAGRATGH
ncbi:MarR family transcriptional regulator [Pseudonocardia spinosispora]|uniref:MarR family transcriptional regulator n=1 Tax=Pseudonocardia spinosispora TaxID=103441 RepID=UPI0003FAFAD5|nr:MarR family transcriptional regulator [Pseudonocardia spinosispora]